MGTLMQHPAMQQPRPASAAATAGRDAAHYPRDARNELQRKEQELSQLRMAALHTLEQQVSSDTFAALPEYLTRMYMSAVCHPAPEHCGHSQHSICTIQQHKALQNLHPLALT
jgi:hypothetical protein